MKINKIVWILFLSLLASACSWVDLKPEAENVRVVSLEALDAMSNCHKMGSTTVSVKADVASIARNAEAVRVELETLARNSAIDLGGNTVVPVSQVDKGKQSFVVYTCN